MSDISPELVKQLRDKTSAGMMDCTKALVEAKGDLAAAETILRKKGAAAQGKTDRRTPVGSEARLVLLSADQILKHRISSC